MVTVDRIEKGLAGYVDAEIIPQLHGNGVERVLVGTCASLLIRKSSTIINGYKDNPLVKMTGIMDEDGNVDIETLAEEVKANMPKDGVHIEIPVLGTLTFKSEDIDKIRDYIVE